MASQVVRIADALTLSASKEQPRDQVVDLGAYRQLVVDCRLLKAGTGTAGGRIKLQHAAVNEADAFRDITNLTWVVDSTGTGGVVESSVFLRYVRWVTTSDVAGSPVVIIDIVAKE